MVHPTHRRPGRRSLLAMLGATPLAVAGTAHADTFDAGSPAPATSVRVPDKLKPGGEFDRYVARLAAEDRFSGTVVVAHRGRPVLTRSYGWADRERRIRNGPGTIFALGSVTKAFTGVAVAQLAQQGKVHYEEKVGAYLDGFPPSVANAVTVHQLLTHTSGLADFHSEEFVAQASSWDTVEEFWDGLVGFVRTCEPTLTPGTGNQYSNAGFAILGAIVAQVAEEDSYYDYVRKHIFERAGMSSADFYTTPQWREDRRIAHPYGEVPQGGSGPRVDVLDHRLLIGSPAGGALGSALDLIAFATAFQDNRLLKPEHTFLVASPKVPLRPGSWAAYSISARSQGGWNFGKNGGSNGVNANLDWFPGPNLAVAVTANYSQPAAKLVADKARELITGQPVND